MGGKEALFRVYSPSLGYDKTVRVYLPKGYGKDERKRYPVLYMHDGQNIVRKAAASGKSWEVTKTLSKANKPMIVVGIDCSPNRSQEYCPYPFESGEPRFRNIGDSLADEYLSFLVGYVKPMVDYRYRTLADPNFTYMAGSSLGGLITAYCALTRKGVFSKFGIFSLGYSMAGRFFESDFARLGTDMAASYYCYVGDNEKAQFPNSEFFLRDHAAYTALLRGAGARLEDSYIAPGGEHTEAHWAEQFRRFARFL